MLYLMQKIKQVEESYGKSSSRANVGMSEIELKDTVGQISSGVQLNFPQLKHQRGMKSSDNDGEGEDMEVLQPLIQLDIDFVLAKEIDILMKLTKLFSRAASSPAMYIPQVKEEEEEEDEAEIAEFDPMRTVSPIQRKLRLSNTNRQDNDDLLHTVQQIKSNSKSSNIIVLSRPQQQRPSAFLKGESEGGSEQVRRGSVAPLRKHPHTSDAKENVPSASNGKPVGRGVLEEDTAASKNDNILQKEGSLNGQRRRNPMRGTLSTSSKPGRVRNSGGDCMNGGGNNSEGFEEDNEFEEEVLGDGGDDEGDFSLKNVDIVSTVAAVMPSPSTAAVTTTASAAAAASSNARRRSKTSVEKRKVSSSKANPEESCNPPDISNSNDLSDGESDGEDGEGGDGKWRGGQRKIRELSQSEKEMILCEYDSHNDIRAIATQFNIKYRRLYNFIQNSRGPNNQSIRQYSDDEKNLIYQDYLLSLNVREVANKWKLNYDSLYSFIRYKKYK